MFSIESYTKKSINNSSKLSGRFKEVVLVTTPNLVHLFILPKLLSKLVKRIYVRFQKKGSCTGATG